MSTIRDIGIKIKTLWGQLGKNVLIVVVLILVACLAFGLGRLSVFYGEKDQFKIMYPNGQSASAITGFLGVGRSREEVSLPPPPDVAGYFVASKKSSTYFFPWCPLALRISPVDRIYFNTRASAEGAGYHTGRCNGL